MKIYVISRKGKLIDTIERKIQIRHDYPKGQSYVVYKGKKHPIRDMHGTSIDGYAIYPWGTGKR